MPFLGLKIIKLIFHKTAAETVTDIYAVSAVASARNFQRPSLLVIIAIAPAVEPIDEFSENNRLSHGFARPLCIQQLLQHSIGDGGNLRRHAQEDGVLALQF